MELGILILKEEELLDTLIKKFTSIDVKNITVLESNSLATGIGNKSKKKDINIFGSIRHMLDYFNDESRVVLIPTRIEKIEEIKKVIDTLVSKQQYLFFTVAMSNIEGTIE